jgi:hypothetical protein
MASRNWTVISYYVDNAQPRVDWIKAATAQAAAARVLRKPLGLVVVEVVAGKRRGCLCNDACLKGEEA